MNLIKLQVNTGNQKYPIIIGNNCLNKIKKFLSESSINFNRCLIVADKNVPKKLINKVFKSLSKKTTIIHYFDANEKNKNQKSVDKIFIHTTKRKF